MGIVRPGLCPDVADRKAVGERIGRVKHIGVVTVDPRLTAHGGYDRIVFPDFGFLEQFSGIDNAQNAFMTELLVQRELAFRVQHSHLGAGACAAGAAVERSRPGGRVIQIDQAAADTD